MNLDVQPLVGSLRDEFRRDSRALLQTFCSLLEPAITADKGAAILHGRIALRYLICCIQIGDPDAEPPSASRAVGLLEHASLSIAAGASPEIGAAAVLGRIDAACRLAELLGGTPEQVARSRDSGQIAAWYDQIVLLACELEHLECARRIAARSDEPVQAPAQLH